LHHVQAQKPDLYGLLRKISAEKNDNIRFYLAFSGLTVSETKPVPDMENAEIILLHPFLENITHHTPVFMLLALVCIPSLLVPMHHRLEKWVTPKLVEKNKEVRLAAAKMLMTAMRCRKLPCVKHVRNSQKCVMVPG